MTSVLKTELETPRAEPEYRQCTMCVLDTRDDPQMRFDDNGVCHYYHDYLRAAAEHLPDPERREQVLQARIEQIRRDGKGRDYDCVVGVSGGVDSTFVAMLAREHGLRALAVHCDNGWNSELAVKNIEGIVSRLGFDLFTYVIDWEEFRDLQLAYIKASVVDIEAVTDHAIFATLFRTAGERGIRHILSGTNVVTEQTLPPHWIHAKTDHVNVRAIHRAYGTVPLRTYPFMDWKVKKYYQLIRKVRPWSILNCVEYNKADVKARIIDELGWRDYGGKHFESIFTRFYQGYILPTKFGIDKRRAHLSDLIFSGQITREEALQELEQPIYDAEQARIDREFVLKKFGLSDGEFDELMAAPPRPHSDFETEQPFFVRYPLLTPLKLPARLVKKLVTS